MNNKNRVLSMIVVLMVFMTSAYYSNPMVVEAIEKGTGTGLRGEYFNNIDLTGHKLNRTDSTINFDWKNGSPHISVGKDSFSVRWTGKVLPKSTGTYTFYADSDNIAKIWICGTLVVDKTSGDRAEESGNINLNGEQLYDVKVEYIHETGESSLHVKWSGPDLRKQRLLGRRQMLTTNYSDNFDDGNSDGWTTYGGIWKIADSKYSVEASNTGMKSMVDNSKYTDFTYETDVIIGTDDTNSDAGFIFRVSSPSNNLDGYRGYYAGLSAKSNKVILGKSNNKWTEIKTESINIDKDSTYKLKVDVQGKNIKVYVNGELKITATDSSFSSGQIGLRSYKAAAKFDNILVTVE